MKQTSWISAASLIALLLGLWLGPGCRTEHRVIVDPVEFKPLHLTMDVNIRVQRELEDFFDFEETFADPVNETITEASE